MKLFRKHLGLLIILVVGFLPLLALFHVGLPITHDGVDHVARIANFYISLQEGVVIPRWGALLNWGYGHPVMMFLYPFSSYASSFFHLLGASFTDSVKIVFGIGFIASGISMYLWARNAFNEYAGIAAGVLYMYAPYRFVDLYVRGAIGEHTAFIFPPLVLYFLFKFFKKNNTKSSYWYFLGIVASMASLLLSHNAISIMFLPVIVFYTLYLYFNTNDKKKLIYAVGGLLYGFLLSSFFLLPAFLEGKYTLRDIVTGNEYATRFVDPARFIWGKWNYGITGEFTVQLGLLQWLGIFAFPVVLWNEIKHKSKHLILLNGIFVFFLISLFIQTQYSQFLYEIITTLKKFQFPWRFLSLTVFTTAIITASLFLLIKKEKYKKIILGILVVTSVLINWEYMQAKNYILHPDSFYTSIYKSTTDTGESSPIWSVRFMEKVPKDKVEVVDGEATITETRRSTTRHSYRIISKGDARIKDNTVYFPGWKVYVDGNPILIEFQDPSQRGLITFMIPTGEHEVEVVFEDTKLRVFANIISILSAIGLIVLGIYFLKKYEEK